jgi:hypothetical protein
MRLHEKEWTEELLAQLDQHDVTGEIARVSL